MEIRKLISHGNSSLTLALPSKWLKTKGLKKGDQIEIIEKEESLILNPINYSKNEEITIDVSGLDRTSLTLYIQFVFRLGYKTIKINFSNTEITHIRKQKKVNTISTIYELSKRLIGAEITNQKENSIIITQITNDNYQDLDTILRRLFLLIIDTSEVFLNGIKKNELEMLEIMDEKHRTINNFANYYLRLLNKFNIENEGKRLVNYHIIASLEKIVDIYKHNSRIILKSKTKFSKEAINFISKINDSIRIYYENYYKFDEKKVFEITSLRNFAKEDIIKNISKYSKEELIILASFREIPEQLIDLISFKIK